MLITGNAHDNTIGGTRRSVIRQNTFSGNGGYGLAITGRAHRNRVFNTFIGTMILGVERLGNQRGGVLISGSAYENLIGTLSFRNHNIISANKGNGVTLQRRTLPERGRPQLHRPGPVRPQPAEHRASGRGPRRPQPHPGQPDVAGAILAARPGRAAGMARA